MEVEVVNPLTPQPKVAKLQSHVVKKVFVIIWSIQSGQGNTSLLNFNIANHKSTACVPIHPLDLQAKLLLNRTAIPPFVLMQQLNIVS